MQKLSRLLKQPVVLQQATLLLFSLTSGEERTKTTAASQEWLLAERTLFAWNIRAKRKKRT
jgi:hypothetical protein